MLRRGAECGRASDVRARLVRHREPSAELPRDRVAGTNGGRVDFPEAAARGDQVRIGGSPEGAERTTRCPGAEVLQDGEKQLKNDAPALRQVTMLDSRDVESTRAARLQLLFLVVVALTVAGSTALAFLYHVFWKQPLVDATVLMPRLRSMLSPKPDERFVFLTLAILVPIAAELWLITHLAGHQDASASDPRRLFLRAADRI